MGQRQSVPDGEGHGLEEETLKADYYDLLGVERTASDDEIKKAYRRKALELHPDRNYGNVENATKLFAEVQSAYQVLSDPQERAWYDSHRDMLLRGDSGGQAGTEEYSYNTRMTTADDVVKLMMRFNGRVEYTDASTGFYGGLRDFFSQLAKEEAIACRWESQEPLDYPDFGHKDDDYEEVVRVFYAAWNGFATRKSYGWKDQYRLSDAPDRRIRRLMEKENKKIREDAAREYNDAVRSLIAFVRKRDPRYQENQKSEEERQKILREATQARAARARAERQAKLVELDQAAVPEWAKSRNEGEHEGGFSSESEEEQHEFECVVCDKVFKSEAQFHAHEKSKKHQKQLKQLQKEMREEDEELGLDANDSNNVNGNVEDLEPPAAEQLPGHSDIAEEEVPPVDAARPESLENEIVQDASGKPHQGSESPDSSDDDYAPREEVAERLAVDPRAGISATLTQTHLGETPATTDTETSAQAKTGKAKQKRAKKAAQRLAGTSGQPDSEFRCAMCQAGFPSKTRLFNHIKEEGHAAPLSQTKASKGGKGKKR